MAKLSTLPRPHGRPLDRRFAAELRHDLRYRLAQITADEFRLDVQDAIARTRQVPIPAGISRESALMVASVDFND